MSENNSEFTLSAQGITKTYPTGSGCIDVLENVDLELSKGDFVTISGPSGCGKSTLLMVLGTLQEPDSGNLKYGDILPYGLSPSNRAFFRSKNIGFVFQDFNLVPYLDVKENIMCPGIVNPFEDLESRSAELLEMLGLTDRAEHYPDQLSSGEKQRTALARALLLSPRIIFADEPTGNLDQTNGRIVLDCLTNYAQSGGSVMMATHDRDAFSCGNKQIEFNEGKVFTTESE